jgi:hypothetical protein
MPKVKTLIWLTLLSVALNPLGSSGQSCKQTSFTGSITSEEEFSRTFAEDLEIRLSPLKNNWGWVVSISPKGLDEDWTYPVTFPIRTGEQQVMGTGYGSTVQEKMTYPVIVEFVLTHSDFVEYSKMADEALNSPQPEAAGSFIKKVASLRKGRLTVQALSYEKGNTAETIKRMSFKATVVVPMSFQSPLTSWIPAPCPASGR